MDICLPLPAAVTPTLHGHTNTHTHTHVPTKLRSRDTDSVVNKTANLTSISSQHALSELLTSRAKTKEQAAVLFYVNTVYYSLYSSPFALTVPSLETHLFQTSKTYNLH